MKLTEEEAHYISVTLASLSTLEKMFSKDGVPSEFCLEGKVYRNGDVIGKIKWDEVVEEHVFKPNKKYLGQ